MMTDENGRQPEDVTDVLDVEDSRVQSEALRLSLERRGFAVDIEYVAP